MTTPDDRRYSDEHEWALVDGNIVTVGVTQFATDSLGDVVYVDLPEVGAEVSQFDKFGEIESVKAVSDLFSPIGGTIVEVNSDLMTMSEKVNEDPYSVGWLIKVEASDAAPQLEKLMDATAYDALTAEE
jgi:glycine cleavage system H protein